MGWADPQAYSSLMADPPAVQSRRLTLKRHDRELHILDVATIPDAVATPAVAGEPCGDPAGTTVLPGGYQGPTHWEFRATVAVEVAPFLVDLDPPNGNATMILTTGAPPVVSTAPLLWLLNGGRVLDGPIELVDLETL